MDAVNRLIAEVSFPSAGEHFAVVLLPFTREVPVGMFSETVEKVTTEDRSYRDDIWKCLASDASRVVAQRVFGGYGPSEQPHIFYRPECRFEDVSALLPALGLGAEEN